MNWAWHIMFWCIFSMPHWSKFLCLKAIANNFHLFERIFKAKRSKKTRNTHGKLTIDNKWLICNGTDNWSIRRFQLVPTLSLASIINYEMLQAWQSIVTRPWMFVIGLNSSRLPTHENLVLFLPDLLNRNNILKWNRIKERHRRSIHVW